MISKTLCQSYVWHNDRAFFVSTCNRNSSAPEASDLVYAETLVWEWDSVKREHGALLGNWSAPTGSLVAHIALLRTLQQFGAVDEALNDAGWL